MIALHDGSYGLRYFTLDIPVGDGACTTAPSASDSRTASPSPVGHVADIITDAITRYLRKYRKNNTSKLMGAGITEALANLCPQLPVDLWSKLDIVPFTFAQDTKSNRGQSTMAVDEEAEFMARKTVKYVVEAIYRSRN